MNAKEARQLTLDINNEDNMLQYEDIMKLIRRNAEKGDFYCYYHTSLRTSVKEKLKSDGYDITVVNDQRNGTTVTIKW